jgi:curved DNA-binding protein CbpA
MDPLPMDDEPDHYVVLGVPHTANAAQLKRAYREVATLCHPDLADPDKETEMTKKFDRASRAYEILKDPLLRASFDQSVGYTSNYSRSNSRSNSRSSSVERGKSSSFTSDSGGSFVSSFRNLGVTAVLATGLGVLSDKERLLNAKQEVEEHCRAQLESRVQVLRDAEERCIADQQERVNQEKRGKSAAMRACVAAAVGFIITVGLISRESLLQNDNMALVWKNLVVVLAVTSVEVFLVACAIWRLLRNRRMRRESDWKEEADANSIEALRKNANKAQQKLDSAQRDLQNAREECLSVKWDVAVEEREGVTFDHAVKLGRHYMQRLSSAASSLTSDGH